MNASQLALSPDGACPKCTATSIKAATLTDRFVYLRCQTCGEVWSMPERRHARRQIIGARATAAGGTHISAV